jgi:hypothetical protein
VIRQPRTEQPRCTCNSCPTCTDPVAQWLNDLPARDGDRLEPWDLNRRRTIWPKRGARHG